MREERSLGRRVTVGGHGFHVEEMGAGSPVLLLHGLPTCSWLWRHVQPLLAANHRVFAVDLLGCGRSDKPESGDLGPVGQAEALVELINALAVGPLVAVGHDFGGAVAQVLAARYPGALSGLVLVSSTTDRSWPPPELERFLPSDVALSTTVTGLVRGLREAVLNQAARRDLLDETALAGYLRPWGTPAAMGAFFQLIGSPVGRALAEIQPVLAHLALPSLVLWGQSDAVVPLDEGARLSRLLPGAELEVLAGVGHLLPEEAPQLLATHLDAFLRRTAPG